MDIFTLLVMFYLPQILYENKKLCDVPKLHTNRKQQHNFIPSFHITKIQTIEYLHDLKWILNDRLTVILEAIEAYDGGERVTDPSNANATAGIWATYPMDYLDAWGGLGDQVHKQ